MVTQINPDARYVLNPKYSKFNLFLDYNVR